MLNRLLVAIIGIPILMMILLKGGILLLIFTNLVILAALSEFFKMAQIGKKNPNVILGYLAGFSIPNILYFSKTDNLEIILMPLVLLVLISIGIKVFKNQVENATQDIGITLLGVVYISVLFSHVLLMRYLPKGGYWLLSIQVLVWICDSFAYFTGVAIGRKFFKNGFSTISPKKSIEGAIGGTLATMLGIYLINRFFGILPTETNIVIVLLFGLLISAVAQIGDLGESMFKRELKVKDSGTLLGEHGGVLDRFDSMLFVVPVVYYLLKFLN